ncbi:MAG: Flp pilus assembly complex ATPase component TadA [Candidatus Melainabacteria bacterium]|nr:Flp pilus assembly complex ATPase component TadA [Candidatus Melainabacteria bacterium]
MALVKKDIGELLVDNGLITADELKLVQLERQKTGEPVSLILARLGLATENHLKNALELQYGVNYISLTKTELDVDVLHLLPEAVMREYQMVPIAQQGNRLTVAMVNPNNLIALDNIKYRLKGLQVKPVVCTEDDFQHFMETVYAKLQQQFSEEVEELEHEAFIEADVDLSTLDIMAQVEEDVNDLDIARQAQDAPMVLLANQIIAKAIKRRCSDIHIEPQERNVTVRYRLDGVMFMDRRLPKAVLAALVSRYKIMADLDIAERRVPQDGRIRIKFSGKEIDLRISTVPGKHGEKVVMRILDKSNTLIGLDKLITEAEALDAVREMVRKPFGIIFVTGPTGSGKTTTLYSALAERNSPEVNILTAEDPIEYDMVGITQVQVLREKGLDFANILRSFLRQDPDIMLVGETRDRETAKTSVEAALTGHLVFTTLHTNDAPGAITRLKEMDVDPFLIASATIGVIAQRLVRRICPECAEDYLPEKNTLQYLDLLDKSQEKLAESIIQYYRLEVNEKGWPVFRRGSGCESCNNTGYKGRVGVYEVMRINDEIRELIASSATTATIRLSAKQSGMVPLKDYSLRLVGKGFTTVEEVIRVTLSDISGEDKLCPRCRNPIGEDFVKCPFCQHELKSPCLRCGTLQEEGWTSCPKCGLTREQAQAEKICGNCEAEIVQGQEYCPYCLSPRNGET